MRDASGAGTAGAGPMAIIALVGGVVGLVLTVAGCLFSPFMIAGMAVSAVAIVLGLLELSRINAGASSPDGKVLAVTGVATGGGGCALGGCTMAAGVTFLAGYIALVFGIVCCAPLAGGAG